MSIEFQCCHCHRYLRVPDASVSQRVRCPGCGTIQGIAATESPVQRDNAFDVWKDPGSPFQPAPSLEADKATEANPYQSPQLPPMAGWRGPVPRHLIMSRVQGPAIALMTVAILMLVLLGLGGAIQVVSVIMAEAAASDLGFTLIGLLFSGTVYVIVLVGAIRMRKLKSYSLAVTAATLALMPCSGCCIVSLPCGVWALVVLLNQDVRAAFD
jgi:hypothetical protein